MRSSLAPYAANGREPDPEKARQAARDAWHQNGLVLINPEWVKAWQDRAYIEQMAAKLFGERK